MRYWQVLHVWVSSFIHRDTQKKKKDSQWPLPWIIGGTLFWIFLFILLVRAHKLYITQLKLRKNSACVSKTYFLLKTFSTRFHLSRSSTAQAFSVFFIRFERVKYWRKLFADTNGNKYIRLVSFQHL